jgi:hypothetical protein
VLELELAQALELGLVPGPGLVLVLAEHNQRLTLMSSITL